MKVKDDLILREIANQWVVVPIGQRVVEFNALIKLSATGAELWKAMEEDTTQNDLVEQLKINYPEVDQEILLVDVMEFVEDLKLKGLLAE